MLMYLNPCLEFENYFTPKSTSPPYLSVQCGPNKSFYAYKYYQLKNSFILVFCTSVWNTAIDGHEQDLSVTSFTGLTTMPESRCRTAVLD
jgi:hypothetical protein